MTTDKTDNAGREEKENTAGIAANATESILGPNPFVGLNKKEVLDAWMLMLDQAAKQPSLMFKHQMSFLQEMGKAFTGTSERVPEKGDRRFKDKAWNSNPFYRTYMQTYLAGVKELNEWVDELGMSSQDTERSRFLMTLLTDTFAATNTFFGNPEAMRKLVDTGGKSAVNGVKNLVRDMKENGFMPSQVDKSKFSVGENLATTPGVVVMRNEVLELIQYMPQTETVASIPVMIVPPQINKFYVFDLSPAKSLVQHLVQSGFQVYIISWRNPTTEHKDWGLETYVSAIEQATDAAIAISRSNKVNLLGACAGGVTTTVAAAYLAAHSDDRLNTLTLLVAVLDMADTGDTALGLFASPETIELAKAKSAAAGVLEGSEMAKVFAWLRPNDLVWSYWVNNYLLGNEPPAFDILYWNNDTTRLPAKLHSQLLDMFSDNPLVGDHEMQIKGTPVDLSSITSDVYLVGGTTDHITPWKATYRSCQLFGGKVDYVLSNSGHVQSILNPPGNPKASFMASSNPPLTTDEYLETAERHDISWWEHWAAWLGERSGAKKKAPKKLGNKDYAALDDAPGTYVHGDT